MSDDKSNKKKRRAEKEQEKEAKRRRDDAKRRSQVTLKAVSRTVRDTAPAPTSTKTADKATTASTTTRPTASAPPPIPLPPPANIEEDPVDGDDPFRGRTREPRSRSRSGSPSSSPEATFRLPPLHKRQRAQDISGLSDDEVIERYLKLRVTLDTMQDDNKSRSVSKSIAKYHDKARLVGRQIHPFINAHEALTFGLTYNEDDFDWDAEDAEDDEDAEADEDDEMEEDEESPKERRARELAHKKELFYQYKALLNTIPDLKIDIHLLNDDELDILADFIQKAVSKARGTDTSHLINRMITYLQIEHNRTRRKGTPKLPPILVKSLRGYGNYHTARALVPPGCLDLFDRDWENFCDRILNKDLHLVSEDWPSFLFDLDKWYSSDEMTLGQCLFRCPLFKMIVKSLWTGAISATMDGCRPQKVPGKPPIGVHYELTEVTPRELVYTAVIAREVLTTHDWSLMDYDFNNCDFYNSLMSLFALPLSPWAKEMMAWWTMEVYGNTSASSTKKLIGKRSTTAIGIRNEIKAMTSKARKGKKVARAPSSPAPELSAPIASSSDSDSSSGSDGLDAPNTEDSPDPSDPNAASSSSSAA